MVKVEGLVISTGHIDGDTPPTYSPYHRSNPDLYIYIYHEENFKQGVVACIGNCNDEEDGDAGPDAEKEARKAVRLTKVCSGAWEMKNAAKGHEATLCEHAARGISSNCEGTEGRRSS